MVNVDSAFEDAGLLHGLLQEHLDCTGSKVANFILNDLDNQLQHFRKVFPRDYKKVLVSKLVTVEGGSVKNINLHIINIHIYTKDKVDDFCLQ